MPSFKPILSAIGTPSYKIVKFLVPKMNCNTCNELTVKNTFCFAKEIAEQIISEVLYKHKDGVAMGSPLGST